MAAKKEIYGQVVRLTLKLKKTGMPQKICWALKEGNAEKINILFNAFPMYHEGLYNQIYSFGQVFNRMVGLSDEDLDYYSSSFQNGGYLMYLLADTEIISHIANADSCGDNKKVLDLIKKFNEEYPALVGNLISFQRTFIENRDNLKTGHEGEIFGLAEDENEDLEVFAFNELIDAMSFFIFTVLANIHVETLFYGGFSSSAKEAFETAIAKCTSDSFAYYAARKYSYNYIGYGCAYSDIGSLMVDAYNNEFNPEFP